MQAPLGTPACPCVPPGHLGPRGRRPDPPLPQRARLHLGHATRVRCLEVGNGFRARQEDASPELPYSTPAGPGPSTQTPCFGSWSGWPPAGGPHGLRPTGRLPPRSWLDAPLSPISSSLQCICLGFSCRFGDATALCPLFALSVHTALAVYAADIARKFSILPLQVCLDRHKLRCSHAIRSLSKEEFPIGLGRPVTDGR